MLNKNVPYLPKWVKLIVTSRNQLMCTSSMLKIGLWIWTPRMWDTANKRDLHMYANQTLQNFIDGTSSNEEILRIQQLIDHALKFCKGNFLFLKTVIKNWQLYPDKMNIQSIPESLEDLYATSFTHAAIFKKTFETCRTILRDTSCYIFASQIVRAGGNFRAPLWQNYNIREVANPRSEYFKLDSFDPSWLEFHH